MFYYGRQLLFIEKPKKKGLEITKNKQTNPSKVKKHKLKDLNLRY